MYKGTTLAVLVVLLGSCAGRDPRPIATVQAMSTAIIAVTRIIAARYTHWESNLRKTGVLEHTLFGGRLPIFLQQLVVGFRRKLRERAALFDSSLFLLVLRARRAMVRTKFNPPAKPTMIPIASAQGPQEIHVDFRVHVCTRSLGGGVGAVSASAEEKCHRLDLACDRRRGYRERCRRRKTQ
jgi:hypothetical protein